MERRREAMGSLLRTRVHVVIDRPVDHCHKGMVYPVNYGFIPGLMGGDGEEQDAYILGVSQPLTEFDGRVIAAVLRKNDCEDKLIVVPEGMTFSREEIEKAVVFQEQYFDTEILLA